MHIEPPPSQFADIPKINNVGFDELRRLVSEHRPWRKLRYTATEMGVDPIAAWRAVKAVRRALRRDLPLRRWEGGRFGIEPGPALFKPLFEVDRVSGDDLRKSQPGEGAGSALRKRIDALLRRGEMVPDRMRARTLMNEAAESSIMEGAAATRAMALDMLRTGRAPATRGERMILNNFEAMRQVKRSLARPMSIELLLELQQTVTDGTLDVPDAGGRLRHAAENVRVVDTRDGDTVFTPPPAEAVVPLLKELCDFANAPLGEDADFLHPIVRACVLHFMIGYVHPFVDGNGRAARALFYWHTLKHGYGIFEYLSISEVIARGPARYSQAYLDTERDDGDLTYFVLYKLDVIAQAMNALSKRLEAEEARIERAESLIRLGRDLNVRQRILLDHALHRPDTEYTVKSHMNSNGIVNNTARADLDDLVRRKLMVTTRRGREVIYHVAPGLAARVARRSR